MDFNYHADLIKQINRCYSNVRMGKDLPWNFFAQQFFKQYLQVKNLSEVEQLLTLLEQMKTTLSEQPELYNSDLWSTFMDNYLLVEIYTNLLITIYQQTNKWVIEYNETNLLSLTTWIFNRFEALIEHLTLKYQELTLIHQDWPLIQQLSKIQSQIELKDVAGSELINLINSFIQTSETQLKQMKAKNLVNSSLEIAFFQDFQQIIWELKAVLEPYMRWVNNNMINEQNKPEFSGFYA